MLGLRVGLGLGLRLGMGNFFKYSTFNYSMLGLGFGSSMVPTVTAGVRLGLALGSK